MKILYHHRIRSKDGQYVHVEELVHAVRSAGHEVVIVGPGRVQQETFGADAGAVAWLRKALPQMLYELLELGYTIPAFFRLLRAARRERPDVIYERYNLFFPAGAWVKSLLRLPLLLEVNAPLLEERSKFGGLALKGLGAWSERYAWRTADWVMVVTDVLGARVRAAGVPPERVVVIPNGINRERFGLAPVPEAAKRALGLQDKCVLGFVGFIREWHGIEHVIEFLAAERDPHLHLLMVGEGPARQSLEATAERLGVRSQVTFTGTIDRDRVANYIAAFDIALQPAVVEYASPLKLFEYLALGKAIVAPRTPNIMEILADGQNALLFDRANPDSLPAALRMLCHDAALRRRLGQAAAASIDEQGLTWERNAERVIELARRSLPTEAARVAARG
jgi:glycosyltransferase involved in cell wall biosynthesis